MDTEYRFLEPGEAIQEGDEFACLGGWATTKKVGLAVLPSNARYYRRKIAPAEQDVAEDSRDSFATLSMSRETFERCREYLSDRCLLRTGYGPGEVALFRAFGIRPKVDASTNGGAQ